MIRFWSRVGKWVSYVVVAAVTVNCGPVTHKTIDVSEEAGGRRTPGIRGGSDDNNVVFEIIPGSVPCSDDGFALAFRVTNNTPNDITNAKVTRASSGGQPVFPGLIGKGQTVSSAIWHDNPAGCGGAPSIQATLTLAGLPLQHYPSLTDSVQIRIIQPANLNFNVFGRNVSRSESRIAVGFGLQNTGGGTAKGIVVWGNGSTCDNAQMPDLGPGETNNSGTIMCTVPADARQFFANFLIHLMVLYQDGSAQRTVTSVAQFGFTDPIGGSGGSSSGGSSSGGSSSSGSSSSTSSSSSSSSSGSGGHSCNGTGGQCRYGYQIESDCEASWGGINCEQVQGCYIPIRTDGGTTNCWVSQ